MKILIVFGTRPEIIKLMPLINKFKEDPRKYNLVICATAQHRDMVDDLVKKFEINIDYDLNVMIYNQELIDTVENILNKIKNIIKKEKPDYVIVQGDTTTSFSAALAAFYCRKCILHIEAGLRTQQKHFPFPEEINRKMITSLSEVHFCPTKIAANNLLKENIEKKHIHIVGNTGIDAVRSTLKKIKNREVSINRTIVKKRKKLLLVTMHRRNNFGAPLKRICKALKYLAATYKSLDVIIPVHPNPNIKKYINKDLGNIPRINLIKPLDYFNFVYLLSNSYFVLTDSGGIQEEAAALGKPVLVCRDYTERPELIDSGYGFLVGSNTKNIIEKAIKIMEPKFYQKFNKPLDIFGDGKASEKIVKIIKKIIQ